MLLLLPQYFYMKIESQVYTSFYVIDGSMKFVNSEQNLFIYMDVKANVSFKKTKNWKESIKLKRKKEWTKKKKEKTGVNCYAYYIIILCYFITNVLLRYCFFAKKKRKKIPKVINLCKQNIAMGPRYSKIEYVLLRLP